MILKRSPTLPVEPNLFFPSADGDPYNVIREQHICSSWSHYRRGSMRTSVKGTQRLLATLEELLRIQATEVKSTLNQAATLVVDALNADKVDIFVLDPSSESLIALGVSATPLAQRQVAIGMDRQPIVNGGRSVQVFHNGEPFITGHTDSDPEEAIGIKEGLGVRSSIIAPLDVNSERRGVVSVTSLQPEHFTSDDLLFLEAVARWVGMVMHRAELVEHITQDAAEQARRHVADELVTVLAHDLRTPLVPVRGYLGMIINEAKRAEQPSMIGTYAERAQRGLDRLMRMITNLLDATRLDQGLFSITLEVVDLASLAQEIADTLSTPAKPIEVLLPEAVVIEADTARMRQAIENLVGNAQRHSPEGVAVTLEVTSEQRQDGPWALISVRDTGPGIAPELLPRLFTRYSSGEKGGALGLGLYLARGIAEAHGGILTVDSCPGKGASFQFAIPYPKIYE